jgi:predicted dehydrogenase
MKIRIGIIGAGENTCLKHIPHLNNISDVEIVAVANRTLESAKKVCSKFNLPTAYEHWSEIINSKDIDAVLIGTWPNMHEKLTLASLKSGKHVLCEARMARNLHEAKNMLNASLDYPHITCQVVPSPFTFKYDAEIIRLINENFFGEILAVNGRCNFNTFINADAPLHWRENREISGNNIMLMGILYESIARWLGHCDSVIASGKIFSKNKLFEGKLREVDVPEHLNIVTNFACGAQGHLQFSSITALEDQPQAVWIFGSEGTAHLDLSADKLYVGKKGDSKLHEHIFTPPKNATWRVEDEFINSIKGIEKVKLTDFQTAYKYMEFTEAVYLSLQQNKLIQIPFS